MLVSAQHQHKSAIGITMFPHSWTSHRLLPHPTPLTCYRAPVWVLKRNTFESVLMRCMNLEPIMHLILIPLCVSLSLSLSLSHTHTHTHIHSFLFRLYSISGSHAPLHPRTQLILWFHSSLCHHDPAQERVTATSHLDYGCHCPISNCFPIIRILHSRQSVLYFYNKNHSSFHLFN